MKKKIIISIIIAIIIILSITIILNTYNSKILFKMTRESWSNGYICRGYTIDSYGIIEEYDVQNKNYKLKTAKISKEELNKLKELIDKVKDSYEESEKVFQSCDWGSIKYEIYSQKLSKWVLLSSKDDIKSGRNSTDASKEILELTDNLYNTYLKEELRN